MARHSLTVIWCLIFAIWNGVHSSPIMTAQEENDLQILNQNPNNDTLLLAHVIYRHGARNIDKIYPNDPYKDEIHWPGGIGQLTLDGKRQQFKLGQYFRQQYGKLLGDKYSANKVYVQSTDTDRTLMSALANLAGLFPPETKEEIWNKNLKWQPIPVHTIPQYLDNVLYASRECPKYQIAYENYLKESTEVQRIYRDYADLFPFLTEKSGANISTITDVYWLYNTLHIEREQNKSLPQWVDKVLEPNGTMEYIATFDFKTYTDTPQTARLKSGFLLKEILERCSAKADSTLQPDRSLIFYSAHDITITNILNSLRLYEPHIPQYASSLHFQLFKTPGNDHYIQIFYRNVGEENLLHIPKCGEKCLLSQFHAIYSDIIPGDRDRIIILFGFGNMPIDLKRITRIFVQNYQSK